MRRIWVYQGSFGWGKDFKWMSVAEFKRSFTTKQAAGFLEEIKKTLVHAARDFSEDGDFYTAIRHTFAEVDGLGKLYCGEYGKDNTAKNAIAFASEYLGQVDGRYKELFGLLVDMYRHGLAHTHLTKCIRFRGSQKRWVTLGWAITDTDSHRQRHLTVEQVERHFCRLWVHTPCLVENTIKAIDIYSADLLAQGAQSQRLFAKFKRGYIGTASVFREPAMRAQPRRAKKGKSQRRTAKKKKKRQQPLTLHQYAKKGIAWVRNEIATCSSWKEPDIESR
jgi:hypothetical protein